MQTGLRDTGVEYIKEGKLDVLAFGPLPIFRDAFHQPAEYLFHGATRRRQPRVD